jgi:hypothetical protein
MTRFIASGILALVLAVAGSLAFDALRGSEPTAAVAASKFKTCKSRTPAGKLKTWRCGADQACCVNHDLGLYVCGFAGLGCL